MMNFWDWFVTGLSAGFVGWYFGRLLLRRSLRKLLDAYTFTGFEDSKLSFHIKKELLWTKKM